MTCKNQQYDYIIKSGDTMPAINYNIPICENIDLTTPGISVAVNMWADSNLGNKISSIDTNIKFKDNYNITTPDIDNYILIKKYNSFEYLKVVSLNYDALTIERAQLNSIAREWGKNTKIKIIKILDVEASFEISYNDSVDLNGQIKSNVSSQSLVYQWRQGDTKNPGDYFMEFKVSMIQNNDILWARTFPSNEEGIKIQIIDNNLEA